ncbi:MAG: HlyD family efflux transporter periplasmic adaptor subunit [Proteobacteria bacterium]|nr:HlyD family efflux transporter periplasmic adaptor subunit [Pseudomonadota bacterium]
MSATSLFRAEAISSSGEPPLGETRIAPSAGLQLTTITLLGTLLLAGFLLSGTTYTRKVPVTGVIDTVGARQILAADHGELAVIAVRENQQVSRHQRLGEIHRHTDIRSIESSLTGRRQSLENLKTTAAANLEAGRQRLDQQTLHTRRSLAQEARALEMAQQQLKDRQSRLDRIMTLRRSGHVSELEWSAYRDTVLEAWQQLHRQRGDVEALRFSLQDLQAERDRLTADYQREISELDIRIAAVSQEQAAREAARVQQLLAPVAGRVTRIPLPEGSHVTPGMAVFHLSSAQNAISGTLYIPSHAAGFVKPGQQLALEVDAFPAERHGTLTATILHVPDHPTAVGAHQDAYLARLSISAEELERSDRGRYLPGMHFRTFLASGRKTLAQWLLDPLLQRISAL